jgi:hypothetical protein
LGLAAVTPSGRSSGFTFEGPKLSMLLTLVAASSGFCYKAIARETFETIN